METYPEFHLYDISSLLLACLPPPPPSPPYSYSFVTNPSLQHWKDDKYLITFRFLRYHLPKPFFRDDDIHASCPFSLSVWKAHPQELCHPWKIWDNSYKFLSSFPDQHYQFLPWCTRKPSSRTKYRQSYGPDLVFALPSSFNPLPSSYIDSSCLSRQPPQECDTTGLAILSFRENSWKVLWITFSLFGSEMNQDTRLYHHPHEQDEFLVTYNGFFQYGNKYQTEMLQRRLFLHWNSFRPYVYITEERPLLYRTVQPIEKNCLLHEQSTILYRLSFHSGLSIQTEFTNTSFSSPLLSQLQHLWKRFFGPSAPLPLLSLGGPPIWYDPSQRWLLLFHYKIPYRDAVFSSWLHNQQYDTSPTYRHGKFIYALGFLEYDVHFHITRLSFPFIPSSSSCSHLPFWVCFQTGLCWHPQKQQIWISYGEGDVRTKLLSISPSLIENMLWTEKELALCLSSPEFTFPSLMFHEEECRQQKCLVYYGYFYERNAGDDAFLMLHRYFYRQLIATCPSLHLYPWFLFRSKPMNPSCHEENDKITALIFAGGDIIHPYFFSFPSFSNPMISPTYPTYAISVGIPYTQHMSLLQSFHEICLRNPRDISAVHSFLPSTCSLHTFPDLIFGISPSLSSYPHVDDFSTYSSPRIGINICRTYYEKDSSVFPLFLVSLAQTLTLCLEDKEWKSGSLHWIPFCTPLNGKKHSEDDRIIHQQLYTLLPPDCQSRCTLVSPTLDLSHIEQLWSIFQKLDFLICTRFHAHVFAISLQIPFVSLACSRKCRELLLFYHLDDLSFPFVTTSSDKPKPLSSPHDLASWILQKYHQRDDIQKRLHHLFFTNIQPGVLAFTEYWKSRLRRHLPLPSSSSPPTFTS